MTHIDPFAPGDSPQHPSNWRGDVFSALCVEDTIANLCQWRRDHLTMASETDVDVAPEELEERHERYNDYLDHFGYPDEREPDAEFTAFPVLLRRAVLTEHDDDQHEEWAALFEQHATDEERDPLWVEDIFPSLDELRARARVTEVSATGGAPIPPATAEQAAEISAAFEEEASPAELPSVPKATALKEDWVEYALAVAKARGEELTQEQADSMTIAALKDAYKPQAD